MRDLRDTLLDVISNNTVTPSDLRGYLVGVEENQARDALSFLLDNGLVKVCKGWVLKVTNREFIPQVSAIEERAERRRALLARNRKLVTRLVDKLAQDTDPVELANLLDGVAQGLRKTHEERKLEERKKYGIRPED